MNENIIQMISQANKLIRKLGCPSPKFIKILCVDDNTNEIKRLTKILDTPGEITYQVDSINGYISALNEIYKKNHDIYFVNCELWGEQGIDLIKECLNNDIKGPYIFLCSNTSNEEFYKEIGEIKNLRHGMKNISFIRNYTDRSYEEIDTIVRNTIKNYRINNSFVKFGRAVEQKRKDFCFEI